MWQKHLKMEASHAPSKLEEASQSLSKFKEASRVLSKFYNKALSPRDSIDRRLD